jgi:hypothetical protein
VPLQTEYEFTLPKGYVDGSGEVHRHGTMRLATAGDEILPLRDPRVLANESYLTIILMSRVITQLGSLPDVNPRIVEGLFVEDLAYLQELYNRVNRGEELTIGGTCPKCGETVEVRIDSPGE